MPEENDYEGSIAKDTNHENYQENDGNNISFWSLFIWNVFVWCICHICHVPWRVPDTEFAWRKHDLVSLTFVSSALEVPWILTILLFSKWLVHLFFFCCNFDCWLGFKIVSGTEEKYRNKKLWLCSIEKLLYIQFPWENCITFSIFE